MQPARHYLNVPYPLAYLITFTCYGARLHGNLSGSVGRGHRMFGTPLIPANSAFEDEMQSSMLQPPVTLNENERTAVLESLKQTCDHFAWSLLAAHIRTKHIHAVVSANCAPEFVMRRMKSYASRHLNQLFGNNHYRWTRHGSTRYLWNEISVAAAIQYVIEGQGEPMALHVAPNPTRSRASHGAGGK